MILHEICSVCNIQLFRCCWICCWNPGWNQNVDQLLAYCRTGSVPCDREGALGGSVHETDPRARQCETQFPVTGRGRSGFAKSVDPRVRQREVSWLSLATSEGGSQLWTRASSQYHKVSKHVYGHFRAPLSRNQCPVCLLTPSGCATDFPSKNIHISSCPQIVPNVLKLH